MKSNLIKGSILSPNHSGYRNKNISRITVHCFVGEWPAERMAKYFSLPQVRCSANYVIGKEGKIFESVPENYRSWCSSSYHNDQRAVTIECASLTRHPYTFPDKTYQALVQLAADVCRRNGKTKIVFINSQCCVDGNAPNPNTMYLTLHKWYANKACPGQWFIEMIPAFCHTVNMLLGSDTGKEPHPARKSESEIAREVILGRWGNGKERKEKLTAAGYDYEIIQEIVNNILRSHK